ncbi:hypothetical protein G6R29_01780 [Fructobacillus sp. M2-14]|uniref:Uncharacterized protein n=1 Tax=Fructobacillus broussonetiae TaxID=2713173 RepID=A0ABS5QYT9_9LACO|nr:hypothetical protein [Fructobacillus broussonetiae]MBS9338365.1 hypothetical protein [Fructobacillus broussonetiae]
MPEQNEALPVVFYEAGEIKGLDDVMAYIQSFKFPEDLTDKDNFRFVTSQRANINKLIKEAKKLVKKGKKEAADKWEAENHKELVLLETIESLEADLGESVLAEQNQRLAGWLPQLEEVIEEQNRRRELDENHKLTSTKWRLLGSFTPTGKLKNSVVNEIVKEADLQKYKQNEKPRLTEKQVFVRGIKSKLISSWGQIDDDGVYSGSEVKQLIDPIRQYILDNNK